MMRIRKSPIGYGATKLTGSLILAGMVACGPPEDPGVSVVEQALTSTDYVDASGKVTVRVTTCDYPATATAIQTATCPVDLANDFILVGGGAEIEGEGTPGAVLQASYPDPFSSPPYSRWVARSTQYMGNFNHKLRAYTIGLRLAGITAAEMRTITNLREVEGSDGVTSGNPSYNNTLAEGQEFQVVGGGGLVLPPLAPPALYLTQSVRDTAYGWRTTASNNGTGATGQIKSVGMGLRTCPYLADGTPWGCLTITTSSTTTTGTSNYLTASRAVSAGDVVTAVGGYAVRNGSTNRFITDQIPFNTATSPWTQGSTLRSKNSSTSGSGTAVTTMVKMQKLTCGAGTSLCISTGSRTGSCPAVGPWMFDQGNPNNTATPYGWFSDDDGEYGPPIAIPFSTNSHTASSTGGSLGIYLNPLEQTPGRRIVSTQLPCGGTMDLRGKTITGWVRRSSVASETSRCSFHINWLMSDFGVERVGDFTTVGTAANTWVKVTGVVSNSLSAANVSKVSLICPTPTNWTGTLYFDDITVTP